MNKHSLSYFDLNPKPTALSMLGSGLKYLASLLWAVAVVYGITVFLFSF
jgi:hypothetical protein